jgi:hypothetical protein
MIRNGFLAIRCAPARDGIRQWFVNRKPTQTAGFPFAKIFGDSFFLNGFPEKYPRFVSPFRRDANLWKFPFRIFWPVAATETIIKPHNGRPHFITGFGHRVLNQVLENWMPGHANVGTRNQCRQKHLAPFVKEFPKLQLLSICQDGETRKRITLATGNRRWQTLHPAAPGAQFGDFSSGKFQNAVRRIGADSMDRVRLALAQPVEAIRVVNPIHSLLAQRFSHR